MPRSAHTVRLARQVAEALVVDGSSRTRSKVEGIMRAFIELIELLLRTRVV